MIISEYLHNLWEEATLEAGGFQQVGGAYSGLKVGGAYSG